MHLGKQLLPFAVSKKALRITMDGHSYAGKYADELKQTAAKLVAAGKGILAADESSGTVGKRVSNLPL